jgi:hypothetical protein
MSEKTIKQTEYIHGLRDAIGKWISLTATPQSLITLQHIDPSETNKSFKVMVSVLPESEGPKALAYLTRHTHDLAIYLRKAMPHRMIPFIRWELLSPSKNQEIFKTETK